MLTLPKIVGLFICHWWWNDAIIYSFTLWNPFIRVNESRTLVVNTKSLHTNSAVSYLKGGCRLQDLSISHAGYWRSCDYLSALIGGKYFFSKKSFARFALQSECCNFNQLVTWSTTWLILKSYRQQPPISAMLNMN